MIWLYEEYRAPPHRSGCPIRSVVRFFQVIGNFGVVDPITHKLAPSTHRPHPPVMTEKEALLRTSYAAFNARDIAVTLRALGPDVEWPDQLEGVLVHGLEAVADYWQRQWAVMDPHFELKHFEFDGDGHLVVTLLQTVRGMDGIAISKGLVRHVYEFEQGLVRRMRILL